jgi:hypothetical protein
MRNTICRIRNFVIYLPPVLLLATAGILLLGLLYYPTPSTPTDGGRQIVVVTDENHWRIPAEDLLAILLADALRQLQEEQNGHARTLMYQYDSPSTERRPFSRAIPPWIENGRNPSHPVLIWI